MITNDASDTRKIKSRIARTEASSPSRRSVSSRKFGLNLRKKLVKFHIWSIVLYRAQTLTFWNADYKYMKDFKSGTGERLRSFGPII
jgi:hypothetical protein